MEGRTIRITSIEAAPLIGDTPKGGWDAEIKPEDSIHALIAVYTDAGITGHGSVYTDGRLVQAGLRVLELPVHEHLPWGILVAPDELAGGLLELVGGP